MACSEKQWQVAAQMDVISPASAPNRFVGSRQISLVGSANNLDDKTLPSMTLSAEWEWALSAVVATLAGQYYDSGGGAELQEATQAAARESVLQFHSV